MNKDENLGGAPAEESEPTDPNPDFDHAWTVFSQRLGHYLAQMTDPNEGDHLVIEVPGPASEFGITPYAQFAAHGDGTRIRAEISGNFNLSPTYQCAPDACDAMTALGWQGNDEPNANWFQEVDLDRAVDLARVVAASLRDCFGIGHPQLMTYKAWGPSSATAGELGLEPTRDVVTEPAAADAVRMAYQPIDRDHLCQLVSDVLEDVCGDPITIDEDGDFALDGPGQPVWVHVCNDSCIEIMAIAATGVFSPTQAALELSILNRDTPWIRWALRGDRIWQSVHIPATPFAPGQLVHLLEVFGDVLVSTRGDLALRLGAKAAL